jgi:hypothetical protein
MVNRFLLWALSALIAAGVPATARAADPDPELAAAEEILREAKVATDSAALLEFFRQRTLPPADRAKLEALVRKLGDDDFETREKAYRDLVAAGRAALDMLRAAQKSPDAEIARRAESIVRKLDAGNDLALIAAAARVLGQRRPAGAVKVLLAYLPLVQDESVEEALFQALAAAGLHDGKADPALTDALTAKAPGLRAAAAFALARLPAQRDTVRRLLADTDVKVRFHAASALFLAEDRAAVPVLIEMLARAPETLAWKAEELLTRLLNDKEPPATLNIDKAERTKCAAAWQAWWKDNQAKTDLAKLKAGTPYRHLVLIGEYDSNGKHRLGRVWLQGKDGKVRWELNTGIMGPTDAHLLANGHVLISEHRANRVTERDRTGKVIWEYRTGQNPNSCQRLPNGNTFIATYGELLEVTREGKKVYSYHRGGSMYCAVKTRDNHIVYVTSGGQVVELDARTGKDIVSLNVGGTNGWGGVDKLPNGNYLVAQYGNARVVEVDKTGKTVWTCAVASPALATRLRNGHTLVSSIDGRQIVEVNRSGKVVWSTKTVGRPFRVRGY